MVQSLQEILAEHIITSGDYLEDAFASFMGDFMQCTSGVYIGLAVTQNGANAITVATGGIFQSNKFGTLESASGVTISLPSSGTRTDLVTAYYEEVYDQPSPSYVLMDVVTGSEQIQTLPTRKFGACRIQVYPSTTYATRPSNRIPLYEVTMSSSTITTLTDVRVYALVQRFVTDVETDWMGLFYAGF